MKVLIEPKILTEMLERVLIGQKLSNVILEFSAKGVKVNDATLGGLGVVALFKPEYFLEYEPPEKTEKVIVSQNLLKLVSASKTFSDEKVSVFTTDDEESGEKMVVVEGKNDRVEDKCADVTTEPVPFDIQNHKSRGIVLKELDPTICIRSKKDQFALPKLGETKTYNIVTDNGKILLKIKDEGTKMDRTIKPTKLENADDGVDHTFDGTFFDIMVGLLPEEIWISLYRGGGMVLSVKADTYAVSYFLPPSD